jgi:1-acyl-sn-glycerol-3-phosphate acyltransferase
MRLTHPHDPAVSFPRVVWWNFVSLVVFTYFTLLHRLRWWGSHHVPRTGPVLFVMNHQSHYDPVLLSLATMDRTISFFGRASLFTNPLFGALLRSVNALPVERGGRGDLPAIRLCLDLLKSGRTLLMFPEGTRGTAGEVAPFQPGILLMIRRARPAVVPVAIEGSRFAFPRGGLPRPFTPVLLRIGEPIPPQSLIDLGDGAIEHLRRLIETMRIELAERLPAMQGPEAPGSNPS